MSRRRFRLLANQGLLRLILLAATPALFASQLTVASYTATPGSTGSFTYFDSTGHELTDGVFGVIPFSTQAEADPWVGWQAAIPEIVFSFASAVNITEVDMDFAEWTNPAQTSIPSKVTINGNQFTLTGSEIPNGSRGTLAFAVALNGVTTVTVDLTNSNNYLLMDEATFFGSPLAPPSSAPEPASLSLAAIAVGTLAWWKRRSISAGVSQL